MYIKPEMEIVKLLGEVTTLSDGGDQGMEDDGGFDFGEWG